MTGRGGVLLLHGYGRLGASMAVLGAAARRAGYATYAPSYPYRPSMSAIVAWLASRVAAFEARIDGPLHIVTHSMGGLVARALIAAHRPRRLGRVVMLAPPHGGSELADLLMRLRLGRLVLGEATAQLRTARADADEAALGPVDFELGVIAGDRALLRVPFAPLPAPHDGKVSVASTRVAGLSGHQVLPVSHTLMVYDRRVTRATLGFLAEGRFGLEQAA